MRGRKRWAFAVALAVVACGDDSGGGDAASDAGDFGNAASGGSASSSTGGSGAAAAGGPASGSVAPEGGVTVATADCASVQAWDPASEALEDELLGLLNEQRAGAGGCPAGEGGTLQPLTAHELLRCAARLHARDMATRDFFDTVNPDGQNTGQRIMSTGYDGVRLAENVGRGQAAADLAIAASVCTYVMDAAYREVGIGHFAGETGTAHWTIDFGG
jgi:uncharacterized protein YkwD